MIAEDNPDVPAQPNLVAEVATRLELRNSRVTMEVYAQWIEPDDSGAAAVVPDYSKTLRAV